MLLLHPIMEFIPIKTRIMQPPKDDLYAVLDEYLTDVQEGDVVLISSKVIAIHQGRCLPGNDEALRQKLIAQEAEVAIQREYWETPLTIKNHAFIGSAGVDQSNGDGHYILLPENPFVFAQELHNYIRERHKVKSVGVIITDSHSQPFRYGATGIALAFWGLEPLQDHIGREDLFGRQIVAERSNLIDGLASGAVVVSGEVNECRPVVIARNVPNVTFVEGNKKDELFVSPGDDLFRVLYERYIKE